MNMHCGWWMWWNMDVGEGLVVILHVCVHGWLVVIVGSCVVCCALIVAIHVCGQLLVVVGGGHYGWLSLFVVVHWW